MQQIIYKIIHKPTASAFSVVSGSFSLFFPSVTTIETVKYIRVRVEIFRINEIELLLLTLITIIYTKH